jgi:hypothetical protein
MAISKEITDLILWDSKSLTVRQLSEKYSVKGGTIRAFLRKNSVAVLKANPNDRLVPKEKLESLLANGWMGVYDLAAACNCGYHIVKKSLTTHGILKGRKPHTRNRVREGNRAFKVLGYLMANPEMALEAIGKKFNCSREFVSQVDAMARKEGIIKSWTKSSDELYKEAQQEGIKL